MLNKTLGTKGYSSNIQNFVNATIELPFDVLHKDFLPFIPEKESTILDLGAGIGRDAYEFSKKGHTVFALEPLKEFRLKGKRLFKSEKIHWIEDTLPELEVLEKLNLTFNFVLLSGVWHHLNEKEQELALIKISKILNTKGKIALSLRNGPAGLGSHTFPTNGLEIRKQAEDLGLTTLLHLKNQASLMKNKPHVTWSRLVFEKKSP